MSEPLHLNDDDDDDGSLHQLFGVLRERVVTVTSGFQARLQGELDTIDSTQSEPPVSMLRVFLSSVLQASNVLLGALTPDDSDEENPDDHSG